MKKALRVYTVLAATTFSLLLMVGVAYAVTYYPSSTNTDTVELVSPQVTFKNYLGGTGIAVRTRYLTTNDFDYIDFGPGSDWELWGGQDGAIFFGSGNPLSTSEPLPDMIHFWPNTTGNLNDDILTVQSDSVQVLSDLNTYAGTDEHGISIDETTGILAAANRSSSVSPYIEISPDGDVTIQIGN